jgi:hypothetical protein
MHSITIVVTTHEGDSDFSDGATTRVDDRAALLLIIEDVLHRGDILGPDERLVIRAYEPSA